MPDQSDQPAPGPHVLVLRAAFVPDGETPPPELNVVFDPLRFPVTLDPATGELTGQTTPGFDQPVSGAWYPDNDGTDEGIDIPGLDDGQESSDNG